MLKILYHLVAGQTLWSEANPFVKARVVDAKVEVINHIKMNCGGLLVDTPTTAGGNTNTGPVVTRRLTLSCIVNLLVGSIHLT